jgi:zinc/manganese transport system substrate-binding protein
MNNMYKAVLLMVMAGLSGQAVALELFACEPEWGALAQELGGDRVSVYVASNALQDPHHVEAKPSLLAKARRAQLVVCTGAELEVGWMPMVLRQSGNAAVQPDRPGYFEAANYVTKLEVPRALDRAAGDVHAAGNPHIQTDPGNIARVAEALAQRMGEVDAANASFYRGRYDDFAKRWEAAMRNWQQQAAPLKGVSAVAHHRSWPYLYRWLGLKEVAELEPKPGVEPTAAHLEEVLAQLKAQPARVVIRSAYEDPHADEWLAERAHIPAVQLPFTVGGDEQAKDLFGLYDDTIRRLLGAVK